MVCELNGKKSGSMPGLSEHDVTAVQRFSRRVGAIQEDVDLAFNHLHILSAQLSAGAVHSLSWVFFSL